MNSNNPIRNFTIEIIKLIINIYSIIEHFKLLDSRFPRTNINKSYNRSNHCSSLVSLQLTQSI